MSQSAHQTYLETQVRTATPQKLRLMLIENAIRFGRQALELWSDDDKRQECCTALARCNDILTELYSSVRDEETTVVQQVRAIYRFLLTELAQASSSQDPQSLCQVIDVLETERETWRQICAQIPEAPQRSGEPSNGREEVTTQGLPAIPPQAATHLPGDTDRMDGLSLEA